MRRTRLRLRAWGCVREGVRSCTERYCGGPHPLSVSVSLWVSPSISKILMVLSEEQVANRRP